MHLKPSLTLYNSLLILKTKNLKQTITHYFGIFYDIIHRNGVNNGIKNGIHKFFTTINFIHMNKTDFS
jgi:hypothetical protein